MKNVVASVRRVPDSMNEITSENDEQMSGIELATRAIGQAREMTRRHATHAEQATSAREALQELTAGWGHSVRMFNVDTACPRTSAQFRLLR